MKCKTEGCYKEAVKKRKYCNTCSHRKYRKRHPVECAFSYLKSNAKKRNKVFTITIDDFRKLIEGTNYITKRGRRKREEN